MSGLLDDMRQSSAERVRLAIRRESLGELERRARRTPAAPPLKLSSSGFDVIAELKLRSPAAGVLKDSAHDWRARVAAYARAGAAAVSVLTEPTRFDGSLEHLEEAARVLAPLGVPAMRKDFLVDPYQVLEARAAGAGGVLVIVRMLSRASAEALLDAGEGSDMVINGVFGPCRVLRNEASEGFAAGGSATSAEKIEAMRRAQIDGDVRHGLVLMGQVASGIEDLITVSDFVPRMAVEARQILAATAARQWGDREGG